MPDKTFRGGSAAPGHNESASFLMQRVHQSTLLFVTFVTPDVLPVWVLAALVGVVFAEPYVRWQRGLAFTVITAGCVLALGALARFQNISHLGAHTPALSRTRSSSQHWWALPLTSW